MKKVNALRGALYRRVRVKVRVRGAQPCGPLRRKGSRGSAV
jgi:hypothetical protein